MQGRSPESASVRSVRKTLALAQQNAFVSQFKASSRYFSTSSARFASKHYDVLIVGGGMVGCSMACALGATPICRDLSVGLVEGGDPIGSFSSEYTPPAVHELRVSSINPGNINFYKTIGVWDDVCKARVAPFYDMKVWDANFKTGGIEFNKHDLNLQHLGAIVENNVLQWALMKSMKKIPNLAVLTSQKIEAISVPPTEYFHTSSTGAQSTPSTQPPSKYVSVKTSQGDEITARLVIGADGIGSIVRQQSGIASYGYSYNQKGVVGVVELEQPTTTAWQRFLPGGPIALLPLSGNYGSIVWSTPADDSSEVLELSDEAFAAAVQSAFTSHNITPSTKQRAAGLGRFGSDVWQAYEKVLDGLTGAIQGLSNVDYSAQFPRIVKAVGRRGAFPLRLAQAEDYIQNRVALIGDACHVVHPLAGQGVNLGIQDCISLSNVIARALETGQDIGSLMVLQGYQSDRKFENSSMQVGVDLIQKLFGTQFTPLVLARAAGVNLTNKIQPLKTILGELACGTNVDLSNFQRIE